MAFWEKDISFNKALYRELATNLYESPLDVFREFVSNGWDGEATKVRIEVKNNEIVVEDNGVGIENVDRFLDTGFSPKRNQEYAGRRPMIGRKGIGKLGGFMLGNEYKLCTRSGKITHFFSMDINRSKASGHTYNKPTKLMQHNGTKVVITKLNVNVNPDKLSDYLSERFTPLLKKEVVPEDFRIFVNSKVVEPMKWPEGRSYKINIGYDGMKISGRLIEPEKVNDRGPIFLYHNGVLISDSFYIEGRPNFTGYIIENCLDIQTSRNNYVKNKHFTEFKKTLKDCAKEFPVTRSPVSEKLEGALSDSLFYLKSAMQELDLDLRGRAVSKENHSSGSAEANRSREPGIKPSGQNAQSDKVKKYWGLGFNVYLVEVAPHIGPIEVDGQKSIQINTLNPYTKWVTEKSRREERVLYLGLLLANGVARLLTYDSTSSNYFATLNKLTTTLVKKMNYDV